MAESRNILLRSRKKKIEELLRTGRLPEARVALEQLCQQQPRDDESWQNLGALSGRLGMLDAAEVAFKRALALRGDNPEIYINLAHLCDLQGRFDEEISYCRHYLRLKPNDAEAYAQIGRLLHRLGRLPEAEQALREAQRCSPDNAAYSNNLGIVLSDLGRYDEALICYQTALRSSPGMDDAYCNLGNLHKKRGEVALAEKSYLVALDINPLNSGVRKNLGILFLQAGRNDEALRCFEERLRQVPECAESHWNRALLLLAAGHLHEGWSEYEWRFRCDELRSPALDARYASKVLWDGSVLSGKTLLVYAEQGFGDTVQFCRYIPLVMQRVEHLVFECQPELYRLLSATFSGVEMIQRRAGSLPPEADYDLQIPLLSLPRLFDTVMATIPNAVPYLSVDQQRSEYWQQRIDHDRFNVGVVWAGNQNYKDDRERSISLTTLGRLGAVGNVRFYSLQKGSAAAEAATPPAGMRLVDLAPELDDFATTAAVIANLDLVITVDTAVAHLAGAMGKTVWTLIYSPPDWRWLLEREDSPWYPTMRLFRQEASGEWGPVIERLAGELAVAASSK